MPDAVPADSFARRQTRRTRPAIPLDMPLDLPKGLGKGWTVAGTRPDGNIILTRPEGTGVRELTITPAGFNDLLSAPANKRYLAAAKDRARRQPKQFYLGQRLALGGTGEAQVQAYDAVKHRVLVSGRVGGVEVRQWIDAAAVNAFSLTRLGDSDRHAASVSALERSLGVKPDDQTKDDRLNEKNRHSEKIEPADPAQGVAATPPGHTEDADDETSETAPQPGGARSANEATADAELETHARALETNILESHTGTTAEQALAQMDTPRVVDIPGVGRMIDLPDRTEDGDSADTQQLLAFLREQAQDMRAQTSASVSNSNPDTAPAQGTPPTSGAAQVNGSAFFLPWKFGSPARAHAADNENTSSMATTAMSAITQAAPKPGRSFDQTAWQQAEQHAGKTLQRLQNMAASAELETKKASQMVSRYEHELEQAKISLGQAAPGAHVAALERNVQALEQLRDEWRSRATSANTRSADAMTEAQRLHTAVQDGRSQVAAFDRSTSQRNQSSSPAPSAAQRSGTGLPASQTAFKRTSPATPAATSAPKQTLTGDTGRFLQLHSARQQDQASSLTNSGLADARAASLNTAGGGPVAFSPLDLADASPAAASYTAGTRGPPSFAERTLRMQQNRDVFLGIDGSAGTLGSDPGQMIDTDAQTESALDLNAPAAGRGSALIDQTDELEAQRQLLQNEAENQNMPPPGPTASNPPDDPSKEMMFWLSVMTNIIGGFADGVQFLIALKDLHWQWVKEHLLHQKEFVYKYNPFYALGLAVLDTLLLLTSVFGLVTVTFIVLLPFIMVGGATALVIHNAAAVVHQAVGAGH